MINKLHETQDKKVVGKAGDKKDDNFMARVYIRQEEVIDKSTEQHVILLDKKGTPHLIIVKTSF